MERRLQFFSKGMCSCDMLYNFKEWAAGIHLRTINVIDRKITFEEDQYPCGCRARNSQGKGGGMRVSAGSYLSSFLQNTLKSNQVEINTDARTNRTIARLKEPRELFSLSRDISTQQGVRWPIECQVIDEQIHHIEYVPPVPEPYYVVTGRELRPKPVGAELGTVVYDYSPSTSVNYESPNVALPLQFSRSVVGGTPGTPDSVSSTPYDEIPGHTLQFESRFESGNLAKVVKISDVYYELYLRPDLYTGRHMQWFYFRIQGTRRRCAYRFSIVNMSKPDSLYTCGMKPLLYSVKDADDNKIGWRRCGENISYFRNNSCDDDDHPPSYTLTFNTEFPYDEDTVFLAHSYPYTYSTLQDYLMKLQNDPVKSEFSKIRLLCRSLAGNNIYYLTVTAPTPAEESKKKQAVVITARVHPGEAPSSWMMKGFLDYLTGDSNQAKELREKFIFKFVPMLNPDGVIVGNNRCSLTGRDLNRQYRTVIRETYPSIWYTKVMIRRLLDDCGIIMYCDLHAHSRKHNVFIYGCESKRIAERTLKEQVFPLMLHKNAADKFSFENCKFRIQRSKEGTGRVVLWSMGVNNSYTMEASFGGSRLAGRKSNTHFSTADLEAMGRHFCDTLLDFCDEDPSKERLRNKIVTRLLEEGSNADEPTNIALSDYSSDDGVTSSSSDDEKENFTKAEVHNEMLEESLPQNVATKLVSERKSSFSKIICRQSTDSIGVWCGTGRNLIGTGVSVQRRALTVTKSTLEPPSDVNLGSSASEEMPMEQPETSFSFSRSNTSSNSITVGNHHSLLRARRMAFKGSEGLQRPAPNSCVTSISKGCKETGQTKQINMPPELIVTQAQVYEGQTLSIDIIESISFKEVNSEENSKLPQNLSAPNFSTAEPTEKPRMSRSLSQRSQLASRSFSEPKSRYPSATTTEITAETSARYSFLWRKLWPGSGLPPSCRPVTDRRDSQPESLCKKASLNGRKDEPNAKGKRRDSVPPLNAKEKKSSRAKAKKVVKPKEWDGTTAVEEEYNDQGEEDSNADDESPCLKTKHRRRRRRKLWRVGFQKKNKDESMSGKASQDVRDGSVQKEAVNLNKDSTDKQRLSNPPKTAQGRDLSQLRKKFSTKTTSLVPMANDQQWKARVKFKGGGLAVTAVQCAFGVDGTMTDDSDAGDDEDGALLSRAEKEEEAGEQKRKKKKKKKRKLASLKRGKRVQSEVDAIK